MICEYCKSTDGEQSKYHPGTCGHCGAKMVEAPRVYGTYYGQPVTDPVTWAELLFQLENRPMTFSYRLQSDTLRGTR